jgi:glyoxalase family protein
VAFATANDTTQLEARAKLLKFGLNVTPVLDRQYFHSIYFREPGGVLFEIATFPPDFTIDDPLEHLANHLNYPLGRTKQEKNRKEVKSHSIEY